MNAKTSQLQIRVSPDQKAALKRLAADAGLSVSAYVLSVVLPPAQAEFHARVAAFAGTDDRRKTLAELVRFLADLTPDEFPSSVGEPDFTGIPLLSQNLIAACVEQEAHRKQVGVPAWTRHVPPMERPYFEWDLRSLRPHLMRVAPAAFKRRSLYVADPAEVGA